jgi:hypothetical protein
VGSPFRILFAKAIDEHRSALVIEAHGAYMGGVAWLQSYEHQYHIGGGFHGGDTTTLRLVWEWWRHVADLEDFIDRRDWERPPQIEHRKKLPGASI